MVSVRKVGSFVLVLRGSLLDCFDDVVVFFLGEFAAKGWLPLSRIIIDFMGIRGMISIPMYIQSAASAQQEEQAVSRKPWSEPSPVSFRDCSCCPCHAPPL